MSLKIKICGMRETENIREVANLRPDIMGFIFYKASPRYAAGKLNPETFSYLHSGIKKTGVFVNADLYEIKGIIWKYFLDLVQLHGDESPETCRILYEEGIRIIKTIHIKDRIDFKNLIKYIPCTNYFLFDTSTPVYGGSGLKFDWKVLDRYDLGHPFFISGGIAPGDVSRIHEINNPSFYGVDINSRFEIKPGVKNVEILEKFISGIRVKNI